MKNLSNQFTTSKNLII